MCTCVCTCVCVYMCMCVCVCVLTSPSLTLFAQQVGVEADVVDAEVEPALPGHPALPVTAGVVVDQLLLLRHPKQLTELSHGLLELVRVVIILQIMVLAVLCNDALGGRKEERERERDKEKRK